MTEYRIERDMPCRVVEITSSDGSPVAYREHPGELRDSLSHILLPYNVVRALFKEGALDGLHKR